MKNYLVRFNVSVTYPVAASSKEEAIFIAEEEIEAGNGDLENMTFDSIEDDDEVFEDE